MGTGRESDPLGTVVNSPTTLSALPRQLPRRDSAGGPAACGTCTCAEPAAGPSSRDGGGLGDVPKAPDLAVFHLASPRPPEPFVPARPGSLRSVGYPAARPSGVRSPWVGVR
jgi:hypothetical protein